MAKKTEVSTVSVRLLVDVIRDGEAILAGTVIAVPARRAQIWSEGFMCEPA